MIKEISRRNVLKGLGCLILGAGIGSAGTLVLRDVLKLEGSLKKTLEKTIEINRKKTFAKISSYSSSIEGYIAKQGDSYSGIISRDIKTNACLNDFDGSDLREYYRSLNKDRDMREGTRYIFPKWNCPKK